jgi:hypothetical protein
MLRASPSPALKDASVEPYEVQAWAKRCRGEKPALIP